MEKKNYAFEPNRKKRLELSWHGLWKDMTVSVDGNLIGIIQDQDALLAGREFQLPDNSRLNIQLVKKFTSVELQVLRNGRPLPGSIAHPESILRTAYGVIFFIAGLNLITGVVAEIFRVQWLLQAGFNYFDIVFGLVFLVLGLFVKRLSNVALIIAIVVFALDGIVLCVLPIMRGNNPNTAFLLVRILLIIPMYRGISAIKAIKQAWKLNGIFL
jgi:hypothetical protein